jgi:branched-chain amino acid transport system substrate-binding protein
MGNTTRLSLCFSGIAALAWATSAIAADPIKIGCAASMTGGVAVNGKQVLMGFELWRDDINAKGGLLGRQVQLVCYDDQSNPSNIPPILTKLIEVDKVDLVVGPYATNMAVPAIPILMQHKMTTVAVTALAANSRFHYPGYFVMLSSGPDPRHAFSGGFFAVALAMNPKPKTLALAGADAEFAKNSIDGARDNAKKAGLEIVYDKAYPPSTTDYAPIMHAIEAAHPDILYSAGYNPDTVGMVHAAHETGLKTQLFGGTMVGLASTAGRMQLGKLTNGILYNDAFSLGFDFPGLKDVLKRYQERAAKEGTDPIGYSYVPFAYGAAQILGDAVKAVGGLDNEKIAQYMHAHEFNTVAGPVSFTPDGEWTENRMVLVQFQNIDKGSLDEFKDPKHVVTLWPPKYKDGNLMAPYEAGK